MDEHGKLNMDRIVEENEVIYTFLEMLNTAKIENVNEKFLEKRDFFVIRQAYVRSVPEKWRIPCRIKGKVLW